MEKDKPKTSPTPFHSVPVPSVTQPHEENATLTFLLLLAELDQSLVSGTVQRTCRLL